MFSVPEKYRVTFGPNRTDSSFGNNGVFRLPAISGNRTLWIIASDGEGWEHVSVHAESGAGTATPNWGEMCYVKSLFWDDEDVVMQLHPKRSEYVHTHPHVLHLWRPNVGPQIPTPAYWLVGAKDGQSLGEALKEAEYTTSAPG